MSNYLTQRTYNQSLELDYIKKLYELVEVNKEFMTSQAQMSDITGIPTNVISRVMGVMRDNKLYSRRAEFDPSGQRSYWIILSPYEVTLKALLKSQTKRNAFFNNRKIYNAPAKVTSSVTNKVSPVEIPNDSVIAQARVWVQSAKAYIRQVDAIKDTLESLKAAGMEVDEEGFYRSVNVKHDEKLSTLALVIPYIEALEKK